MNGAMENKTGGKIIFLIPTLYGGGAERVVSELSSNLPDSLSQYIVLFRNKIGYPHRANVIVLDASDATSGNLATKAVDIFQRVIKFRRVVKDVKPDLVFSLLQGNTVNMLVRLSLRGSGYRTIVSERTATSKIGLITKGLYGFLNRTMMKMLYNRADRIIAVSEGVREDLALNFNVKKDKISVIYNPVDAEKIRALAAEAVDHPWFGKSDIPVIINVGRLAAQKNQKDLVIACAELRKRTACRLVIIGEGELKDELAKLAGVLGVSDDVAFLGFQENPFKYMARSSVFVLSSLFEGFPNALVEAMALGCPVVASDCLTGPREILAPGLAASSSIDGLLCAKYGLLFRPGDVRSMVSGIRTFLEDADLRARYSRLGQERARDFSIDKIVSAYLNIFKGDSSAE